MKFYEIMAPRNVQAHTHRIAPPLLFKYEMKKESCNKHANVDEWK